MADRVKTFGPIALRQLFRDEASGKLYRVVYMGGGGRDTILCDVRSSRTDTIRVLTSELRRRAAPAYSGEDRFVYIKDDPYQAFTQIRCEGDGHVFQSELNWERIESLAGQPDEFRKTLLRGPLKKRILTKHAEACGISLDTMQRLHRAYLQGGMTKSAVISMLWRCGREARVTRHRTGDDVEVVKRKYSKRPGKKPGDGGHYACPSELLNRLFAQYADLYLTSREGPWEVEIPEALLARIRETTPGALFPARRRRKAASPRKAAASKSVSHRRSASGRAAHRGGKRRRLTMEIIVDHLNYVCRCTREVKDASGQVVQLELSEFNQVSVRQFQHYYLTNVPVETRKRRTMGERRYALEGRPKHGHALMHNAGPGTEYLIDSTIGDVYVVSRFSRAIVVGRPTIYLCMDLWSRMIVGVHVTLEPPSFEGVSLVLESIVTPKDELCARYGITIDVSQWPCHYLPGTGFIADRGSDFTKVVAWRNVNQQLRVSICNTRARDPPMRGVVERRFGIVPCHYQRASFGVVEADAATRGAPRFSWDAVHTVNEIMKKLLRACLVYNDTPIRHTVAEPGMVFEGGADTPLNRWNWGIENLTGSLREHSVDDVRRATWPVSNARPTDKGLLWNGAYYTSAVVESKLIHCWGADATTSVPIQYNPDDLSQIILAGKDYLEYGTPAGTNRQSLENCSLLEWNLLRSRSAHNAREKKKEQQPARIMENLNNARESREARDEQRKDLRQLNMKHPDTTEMRHARAREVSVARAIRQSRRSRTGSSEVPDTSSARAAASIAKTPSRVSAPDVTQRLRQKALDMIGIGTRKRSTK